MDISILLSSPIWPATAPGLVVRGIVKRGVSGELTKWAGGWGGWTSQPAGAGRRGRQGVRQGAVGAYPGGKDPDSPSCSSPTFELLLLPLLSFFLVWRTTESLWTHLWTQTSLSCVSSQGRQDSSHADSVQRNLTEAPHRHGSSF